MGVIRLLVCVSGVYATFLLWAIAQERLVSAPFPSINHPSRLQPPESDGKYRGDRFPSPIFLTFVQAIASSICAFTYLYVTAYKDGSIRYKGISDITGWSAIVQSAKDRRKSPLMTPGVVADVSPFDSVQPSRALSRDKDVFSSAEMRKTKDTVDAKEKAKMEKKSVNAGAAGSGRKSGPADLDHQQWRKTLPGLILQVAAFQTSASPIGFLALEHISYPTMVLGKSCKLIPVLLLNVLIYRRKFSAHKYVVVALVTVGISLFMLLGDKKKRGGSDSLWGFTLLVINLLLDGLTNSTQDQIFSTYRNFTGQQMMFVMAVLTQLLLLPFLLMPLPTNPSAFLTLPAFPILPSVKPTPLIFGQPAFFASISFLLTHPTALRPLLAFACLGGLGQLFIFETIQHFGSLTLVMVTVIRKLFTMLLSVLVFKHVLNKGQWLGVAVVFSGIGVEAAIKRRDVLKRAKSDR